MNTVSLFFFWICEPFPVLIVDCGDLARITLERRKFLKNVDTAVCRQAMWSNLAHEITAEFRGLCAEKVYLQQELGKLQDMQNKAKMEDELWDDHVSSSSGQNSHLVLKETCLWESLLAQKSQHEVLASGPIEDLIAHRKHRYRIAGSVLLSAMDHSSQIPYTDVLSVHPGDMASTQAYDRELMDRSVVNSSRENLNSSECSHLEVNDGVLSGVDDRSGRVHPAVDIAKVLRRWTHALQCIHKHSLQLESVIDEVSEVTSKLSNVQLEKASGSPALKLPQLFKLTPNSFGNNAQKQNAAVFQAIQIENVSEGKSVDLPISSTQVANPPQGSDSFYGQNLRRSVREAALSLQSCNADSSQDNHSHDGSEHFFVPFSVGIYLTKFSRLLC